MYLNLGGAALRTESAALASPFDRSQNSNLLRMFDDLHRDPRYGPLRNRMRAQNR
jgi:hypothetical protein